MSGLPQIDRVSDVLARHARERPSAAALVSGEQRVSYGELDSSVRAVAAALASLGVGRDSTVGVLCTNRAEWVVTALATISLGGRVAAFNTWSKRWDLDHLLRASGCQVLVAVSRVGPSDLQPLLRELVPEAWEQPQPGWRSAAYPDLHELVLVGEGPVPAGARTFDGLLATDTLPDAPADETPDEPADELAGTPADKLSQPTGPASDRDDVALVLYTSGSTARPKAVALQQGHALEHGYDVGTRMGVTDQDRVWLPVPLFWSYGGANALMVSLTHGCCLVLQEVFDAGQALDLIEREGCTLAYTLPNITAALAAQPSFTADRVATLGKGMTIGSQRDVQAAADVLGITGICNAYGSTEIYGCCSATPHDWPLEQRVACQGPPLPRITVTIRDPLGELMPVGEVGEITVGGQVTTGYLDQPVETAQAFTAAGELRTGDLGFLDGDGNVHYVARATEMIKSGGINIAPAEVEDFLRTHPDVLAAAVVGVADAARGQVAVAYVTVAPGPVADEAELSAYCQGHIASFKVPARIIVGTDALPTTDTGKLSRMVLRERATTVWSGAPGTASTG